MTWKDIKLATIQKMFSADGSTIPADDSTRDYVAAMPYAANEGILMMSTAGKFLVKDFSIAIDPIRNLIGDYNASSIHSAVSGDTVFEAENAHSYYFEVTGRCTYTITVGELVIVEETIDSLNKYVTRRGMIENGTDRATLTFTSDYPYAIKNIALYEAKYTDDSEVPAYAEKVRFKVDEIVEDFHSINSIYFEGDVSNSRYVKTDEVFQEGDKVLALDREVAGNYIIYYNALPKTIDATTEDDYELPLDREVAAILPLYMASQLYKDDDNAIATVYRNEFEVAFERLQSAIPNGKAEKVISESGWI
jgi:hypothetical protein